MDGILDKYLEDLNSGRMLPHIAVTHMYCDIFDQKFDQKLIMMFGKLVKIYGHNRVIMALLDMYDMENIDFSNGTYGLILFFLKKRLEKNIVQSTDRNLMPYIEEVKKRMKGVTK